MTKITDEQIKAWKKQHGDIFKLQIEDKVAYLKTPDRKTLSYATSVATKDPLKFNEIILNNCWLSGDEEIKTDDALFISAGAKLADLIQVKEAELVKL
ncbi:MAG: hypothetical protein H3C36_02855 [Chitinophagaceae bacterium]|nr:hypothetical protein [Chitinophagaceae bacterium]